MTKTIEEIKNKVVPILKNAGITRSSLFGSCVRGEQTKNSDVDILVDFPNDKSLFDFVDVKLKLEESLGKKVDLIEFSHIKSQLKNQILSSQIRIL